MAEAKRVPAAPVVTPPDRVVLCLSLEEATVLKGLLGKVGGGGRIRALMDNVFAALGNAKVFAPWGESDGFFSGGMQSRDETRLDDYMKRTAGATSRDNCSI